MITVPTAPMPVHTAYAVPIGKVCVALFNRIKLKVMEIKKPMLHFTLVKLFESFKQVVKPTSKKPAIINIIQFML